MESSAIKESVSVASTLWILATFELFAHIFPFLFGQFSIPILIKRCDSLALLRLHLFPFGSGELAVSIGVEALHHAGFFIRSEGFPLLVGNSAIAVRVQAFMDSGFALLRR